MNWLLFVVQWLHVLLGIIWFGNSLILALLLIPTLNALPIPIQRDVGGRYGERSTRLFDVVVPLIVVLGFIRGTVLGPIHSVADVVQSAYGITWLVALIAATVTFVWGRLVIVPAVRRMDAIPLDADGAPTPELVTATDQVKRVVILELLGFLVIFTCMILMRFGL
jgi:uncharacterized membrane protein